MLIFSPQKDLFSQKFSSKFYTSPIIVNPANTGRFLGDYRVGGVSRTEKNALYQDITSSFSLDLRILKPALLEQDKLAVGIAALSETDRYFGLKNSYFLISLAYFKGLDEEDLQQLGIGFQTNVSTKRLEPPSLIFEDQLMRWASTGFAGAFSERKVMAVNYVDFNAGLSYQNIINYIEVGIYLLHF